jgi:FlaA1/EpsC-like NDP-sugar epimerase
MLKKCFLNLLDFLFIIKGIATLRSFCMAIFEGKVILVTGGTGSFGGYFVNYLLDKNLK